MAKDLTAALHELTMQANGQTSREDKRLPAVNEPSAIPERVGTPKKNSSGSGSGIASPLVETDYAARTWHPNRNLLTTDGVWALAVKPVKTIAFADANSAEVVIEFKSPPA